MKKLLLIISCISLIMNLMGADKYTISEIKVLTPATDAIEFIKQLKLKEEIEYKDRLWVVDAIGDIPETAKEPAILEITLRPEEENEYTKDFLILRWKKPSDPRFSRGTAAIEIVNENKFPVRKKVVRGISEDVKKAPTLKREYSFMLNYAEMDALVNEGIAFAYSLRNGDIVQFDDGSRWDVKSIENENNNTIRKVTLVRRNSIFIKDLKIITASKAYPKIYTVSPGGNSKLKVLIGALALGIGGVYFANRFGLDSFNYLFDKASGPWLSSLKATFQTALEKLGYAQSK